MQTLCIHLYGVVVILKLISSFNVMTALQFSSPESSVLALTSFLSL